MRKQSFGGQGREFSAGRVVIGPDYEASKIGKVICIGVCDLLERYGGDF
jgi:hypothetical protein